MAYHGGLLWHPPTFQIWRGNVLLVNFIKFWIVKYILKWCSLIREGNTKINKNFKLFLISTQLTGFSSIFSEITDKPNVLGWGQLLSDRCLCRVFFVSSSSERCGHAIWTSKQPRSQTNTKFVNSSTAKHDDYNMLL